MGWFKRLKVMTPSCIGVCCWNACGCWGGGGGGSEERGGEGEGLWFIFQEGVSPHCKQSRVVAAMSSWGSPLWSGIFYIQEHLPAVGNGGRGGGEGLGGWGGRLGGRLGGLNVNFESSSLELLWKKTLTLLSVSKTHQPFPLNASQSHQRHWAYDQLLAMKQAYQMGKW